MFEIVCEVANKSGKMLTIETSIPEADKPNTQTLKSGQQMGVFASPTRSTVKITVVSVEDDNRIEKLEAALIDILKVPRSEASWGIALVIARKALEGKDEE